MQSDIKPQEWAVFSRHPLKLAQCSPPGAISSDDKLVQHTHSSNWGTSNSPAASALPCNKCAGRVQSVLAKKMPILANKYRHYFGGATQSRTGLDGFAIRCITALLSRQNQNHGDKNGKLVLPIFAERCWHFFPCLERETRLELATSTLARLRSTN